MISSLRQDRGNVEVIRALREGLPSDIELMADAWRGWHPAFADEMLRRLAAFGLRWVEEPLLPELIPSHAALRRRHGVPIACGEHEYTRWAHKALLDAGAADVLQPDVTWAGGISETRKIIALASAAGVPVCPHTNLLPPTVHLLAAVSPAEAPLLEYPVYADQFLSLWFLADPPVAGGGAVRLPQSPGLGMELDASKIESQREILRD